MGKSHGAGTKNDGTLCALAQSCIAKYSMGSTRVRVEEMCNHPAQRRLNIPHAHRLIMRAVSEEGFSSLRYGELVLIEPDPDKPLEYFNFTQDKLKGLSGTPPIGQPRPCNGTLSGQHISTGFSCLFAGVPHYANPSQFLAPPPKDAKSEELYDHLRLGFKCIILRHEAWLQCPEGVRAICRLRNYDSAHSLSDTCLNTFEVVAKYARESKGSDGDVERDLLKAKADISSNISHVDLLKMYKLGKVVSAADVDMLCNFANRWISNVELRPELFQSLSELAPGAPKVKIATLMAVLKSDVNDSKSIIKVGSTILGNCIKCKDVERFRDSDLQEHILNVEGVIVDIQSSYMLNKLSSSVTPEAHTKAIVEFMLRAAKALFLSSWKDDKSVQGATDKLSAAEDKLRTALSAAQSEGDALPARVCLNCQQKQRVTQMMCLRRRRQSICPRFNLRKVSWWWTT